VSKRFNPVFLVLLFVFAFAAIPALAGPMPSKTAANQSIDSRDADIALIRDVAANAQVSQALAARGFTQEEVNQRLAQLSSQDVRQLAQNLDQLQAAGLTKQEWIWIGIGALAALILVIALSD
jgi:TolA-binding protein